MREYAESFRWLDESKTVNIARNASDPDVALAMSAAYQHHASLDKFIRKFARRIGKPYILYTKDVMEKNGIVHLPLYMAQFLCERL